MRQRSTDMKAYGKQLFSGVAILAASTFIVKIIGMLYKIPMMDLLGAQGMGYFNSAYEIYSLFFVIATTGIPVAVSILVSENRESGRGENIKRIFRISIISLGIIGAAGTALMAIFHKELAMLINNDAAMYSILAISPTLIMICIGSAIRGYFQGCQLMAPTAVSQVIEALGKLLLGLGAASFAIKRGLGLEIAAAFAAFGLSVGVALSLLYLVVYKVIFGSRGLALGADSRTDSSGEILKQLFAIAIPITLSSTVLSLTKIIDMTAILRRLGDIGYTQEQANAVYGSYSTMAVSVFNLPATLVSAIALPLVPMLTAAAGSGDRDRERGVISASLKLTALVSFPMGLGISAFAKQILSLIFTTSAEEIEYTAPLLALLGVSVFLSSMISVTNAILQAYKEVKKPIISMAFGTAVKLIAAFVLVGTPSINIYGAPISTFFSTLVIVSLNLFFILRRSGRIDTVARLFVKPFVAAFAAVLVGAVVYSLLASSLDSSVLILLVIALVAVIYAFIALKIGAVSEDDIRMVTSSEKIINLLKKLHLV